VEFKPAINDFDKTLEHLKSSIPSEIRLICKVLYDTLKKNAESLEDKSESFVFEIIADLLYFNWLIFALFIQPHVYGLLK